MFKQKDLMIIDILKYKELWVKNLYPFVKDKTNFVWIFLNYSDKQALIKTLYSLLLLRLSVIQIMINDAFKNRALQNNEKRINL